MFGTDFFMTEMEKREAELYFNTQRNLRRWFDDFARINPQKFLMQPV